MISYVHRFCGFQATPTCRRTSATNYYLSSS